MKTLITAALIVLLPASIIWAGVTVRAAAPAMDEAGLIMLGLGLVGTGIALLRRK
ncbi:MAG: IPTL-CTERM sorting domain-containing protein [Candidatus Binatia bacterium]